MLARASGLHKHARSQLTDDEAGEVEMEEEKAAREAEEIEWEREEELESHPEPDVVEVVDVD